MNLKAHHRSDFSAEQLLRIRELLEELGANSFYREKFSGIDPHCVGLTDFSARFPFTTKAELSENQSQHPPFGTNLTYPLARYSRYHQTSGTSGKPLRWLDTPESWEQMVQVWLRIFEKASVRAEDRIFFGFSFGPFLGFWLAFEAANRLGALCLPGGGMSSHARLRAIIDNQATVLCCTPSYGLRLAEVAQEEKIDLAQGSVKKIMVAGEPGGSIPATRSLLQTLWGGARVYDHHGMTEVGPVTYECPTQPGLLHVVESAYFPEVVGADGKPARPEEPGELVLTTLLRSGSPLLRYRTGDIVKPLPPHQCSCGSEEMALLGGIIGRVDDMVIIRGVNVYPSAVEEILRRHQNIGEYQVCVSNQSTLAEMAIRVEVAPDSANHASLVQELAREFQKALNIRVPIEVVAPGTLPRSEMKASRWVVG